MNVGTSGPPQTMTQAPRLLLLSALCAGALTTVSGAALWSSPAWAQGDGDGDDSAITDKDRKRAKKVFEQGQKLFDLRRFAEALEKYQQAYEIAPLPGLLFNIGQAYRNLGDLDTALFSLRKYLKLKPDADNRDATLAYIADIEEEQWGRSRRRPRPAATSCRIAMVTAMVMATAIQTTSDPARHPRGPPDLHPLVVLGRHRRGRGCRHHRRHPARPRRGPA